MRKLQDPLEQGKVKMCLVFELTLEGLLFLSQVITGVAFNSDEYSRQADSLEVGPVFRVEGFTSGPHKSPDTRAPELAQDRFEVLIILDGDRLHPE